MPENSPVVHDNYTLTTEFPGYFSETHNNVVYNSQNNILVGVTRGTTEFATDNGVGTGTFVTVYSANPKNVNSVSLDRFYTPDAYGMFLMHNNPHSGTQSADHIVIA